MFSSHISPTHHSTILLDRFPRSETPIFMAVMDHWSHWEKSAAVAKSLGTLGYPVTLVTGGMAKELTEKLHPNVKFAPLSDAWTQCLIKAVQMLEAAPVFSVEAEVAMEEWGFVNSMEPGYETMQQHFREFRDEYGRTKPLIFISDALFTGHMPMLLGVPGIRPDSLLTMFPHPHTIDSNDTYPFHVFKRPETGPDAKALHWQSYQERQSRDRSRITNERFWAKLRSMGSKMDPMPDFFHGMSSETDHVLKMGVPELEFKRSDLRDNVHYFGAVKGKKKQPATRAELPVWWDDILQAKKDGKKIVAVSQGTLAPDLTELLIPTLEALESRDDVLVVASTVLFEPEDVNLVVPANARAAKFVPYTDLLPLADVLVNNAGYGAVITALSAGIPVVVAGEGQDKEKTAMMIELAGVGVNLESRKPGTAAVKAGLDKILDDPSFKQNVLEMKKSFDSYDMSTVFDGVVQDAVKEWAEKKKNRS